VVYGKRRVGKTELIKRFMRDKDSLYFLADRRTSQEQLREIGRIMGKRFNDTLLSRRGFDDWIEFFEYLGSHAKKPMVVAIDEYPYLVEVDTAVSSLFQKGWDEYLKHTKVFLILSGSSVSMMESEALLYRSPLYGRRSGQLLLTPLPFYDAWQFYPSARFETFLELYAIAGGLPAYLLEFKTSWSVKKNFEKCLFPKTAFLHNEIEFILKEELREPKNYLSVLKAVSFGKTKFSEIVNESGLEKNVLHKYLSTLERLQLIERAVPVTEYNRSRSRGIYRIADPFTRTWFQYVFPYKSELEVGNYHEVMRKVDESFQLLVSSAYEHACQEVLRKLQNRLFPFERVGRWWEKEHEIDVIGLNNASREIVFGECKWSGKQVGTNVYARLKEVAARVDWHRGKRKEYSN